MKKLANLLFVSMFAALPLIAEETPVPPSEEPKEPVEQVCIEVVENQESATEEQQVVQQEEIAVEEQTVVENNEPAAEEPSQEISQEAE